jgi:hypothetical protein
MTEEFGWFIANVELGQPRRTGLPVLNATSAGSSNLVIVIKA